MFINCFTSFGVYIYIYISLYTMVIIIQLEKSYVYRRLGGMNIRVSERGRREGTINFGRPRFRPDNSFKTVSPQ